MSTEPTATAPAQGHAAREGEAAAPPATSGRAVARNTAIFSVATGLSRIAGLVREIVASSYFATSGPFSAFTIAFQVPNVVRSLFADAALSAAFVPVFTEMLEQGRRKEAFKLASTLFFLILTVLTAITVVFVVAAGMLMPLFTGGAFDAELDRLTVGLSRVLFPVVVILGLNGLVVGILNAYDHFAIPAISPLVWNAVILACLVVSHQVLSGDEQLYGYAVGVVAGTAVQLAMALPLLGRLGFRLELSFSFRDERVRQVLRLMLPVTIGLGLINFNLLINSTLGTLVSEQAGRAIDAAFRIYMLPQGMFSVAIATVLFPALSRLAARRDLDGLRALTANGMRQIFLLLIPAAAATLALSTPITRLIYEHGAFGPSSTDLVSTALFWFTFSLPFSGVNLLLTRTFFSLQRPWITTRIAALNLGVNIVVSVALYKPFGIAGIVVGTAASSAAMTLAQLHFLRRELHGRLEGRQTLLAVAQMSAASALLGVVAYGVWYAVDSGLGRGLAGQLVSVGAGLAAGAIVYGLTVHLLRIPEARQIERLLAGRLLRRAKR
ncbi:MAG TPA: murein biosynthesis integral membrane protein MurJ [Solirubrobacteraceae bacterium]|nr:murein biosynthesis integral membrane protein MurJ [Solirubrobacteraceae bacterium]